MFARVSWIAVTVIVLFCVYTSAQISQICLGCICEISTNCNTDIGCGRNYACGPFAITQDYWSDAGKPTLNNESLSDNAYPRCANDPYCAAGAVESYMSKFGRDCDRNGVVDCEDYARIHRLGPNGCKSGAQRANYEDRLKLCLETFQNQ